MTPSNIYREEIIDHSKNPRNFGKLSKPDIKYKENNPLCGDEIEMQLKFDSQGVVKQVAFWGEGCSISKAAASMLTEKIKGKSLAELKKLSGQDVLNLLGVKLGPARLKCAFLALEALKKGLNNFPKS